MLLGIVVILLGATWWWNKSGASKEIKSEIAKSFRKEKEALIKEFETKLEASIDNKIKNYEETILEIKSDVARSMAITAEHQEVYNYSIFWWALALESFLKLNYPKGIRDTVGLIMRDIEQLKHLEKKKKDALKEKEKIDKSKIHQCQRVIDIINNMPDILDKEKKIIMKELENRMDESEIIVTQ